MAYTSKNKLRYPENIIADIKNKFGIDVDMDILTGALETMPDKHRQAISMYYEKGNTYRSTAEALGLNCVDGVIVKALGIISRYAQHNGTRSIYAAISLNNPSDNHCTALRNALTRRGFRYIDDLNGMSYSELLKIRGLGVKLLEILIDRCQEYNVHLVADVEL